MTGTEPAAPGPCRGLGPRVKVIHRVAAVLIAITIATFGALGLVGGLGFFSTQGQTVAGLSTNGALSTVSIVTAAVLIAAAVRGGRTASTTMIVVGVLFLVSAFANLAVLNTGYNLLAFRLPNVFFSVGAGLVLLLLGAYGRVSGGLPADNPYYREAHDAQPDDDASHEQPSARTAGEAAADQAMAEAERAVAQGAGTADQRRRIAVTDRLRRHEDRRQQWMSFTDAGAAPSPSGVRDRGAGKDPA